MEVVVQCVMINGRMMVQSAKKPVIMNVIIVPAKVRDIVMMVDGIMIN